MATTAQELVDEVLDNLGNLSRSAHGSRATTHVNNAHIEWASGRNYDDFRETQSRATFSILTTTGTQGEGFQDVAFSNWASDIWVPISWRDNTNDQKIYPLTIEFIDQLSELSTAVNLTGYAIWGSDLLITPPLSATTSVSVRYISTVSRFTFDSSDFTTSGTMVLPDEYREGVVLSASVKLARVVNPGLVQMWAQAASSWERNRIANVDADRLEDNELTATVIGCDTTGFSN